MDQNSKIEYSRRLFEEGIQFLEHGNFEKAEDHFVQALNFQPNRLSILFNLSIAQLKLNKRHKAIETADLIRDRSPLKAENYIWLGNFYFQLNELQKSMECYKQSIEIEPYNIEAINAYGAVLCRLKKFEESLFFLNQAIHFAPEYYDAYNNRGNLFKETNKIYEAIENYNQALALNPKFEEAHNNLGNAFLQLKQFSDAVACFDRAIQLTPEFPLAHNGRGIALDNLGRQNEALESFSKAIEIKSDFFQAYNNKGNLLKELQKFDQALYNYDRSLSIEPNNSDAIFGKALLYLLIENFEMGLPLYEHRDSKFKSINEDIRRKPLWRGEDITNKTVLVYCEQGLGDTLQFCRYLNPLVALGANVLFSPQKKLYGILGGLSETIKIVDVNTDILNFDYHIPLMSLPNALYNKSIQFCSETQYLFADKDRIQYWKKHISSDDYKIGICWKGNSNYKNDVNRSFSLKEFYRLSKIPKVRLISLHKGEGEIELDTLPPDMKVESFGSNFDTGPQAFIDTAAIMKNCDLIITSDTSIAHLAGALGCPTWVVLAQVPDWRWFLDRTDSPWYPTIRLFRQKNRGDWKSVFENAELELRKII